MTALERKRLERAQADCHAAADSGDAALYRACNSAFHELIYRGTHNKYVADTAAGYRRRLAPFRDTQIHFDDRPRASAHEHEAVVAAILAQESEAAHAAMYAHEVSSSLHAMGNLPASRPA
jgi:DNA-binding GntR family transcriptional regulator